MESNNKIYLPDLEMEEMKEIYACLKAFGLNEGEFTFAPAIGGVLVYDINAGFIWFPKIVMMALGTTIVESQATEFIGNYAGRLGGIYIGGAAGGAAAGAAAAGAMLMLSNTLRTVAKRVLGGAVSNAVGSVAGVAKSTATVLGLSGGVLAVSVLGGAYIGGLVGVKAVRKSGFRDPPEELTAYPKNTIHHMEIISPSIYAKMLEASKKAKDKIVSVITKEDIEDRDSLVLCIVTRFKPQTGELKTLVDHIKRKAKEQEKSRQPLLKPVVKLWSSSQVLLGNAWVGYFNLSKYIDAIRFKNTDVLQPLINTIKAQEIPLIEKYKS